MHALNKLKIIERKTNEAKFSNRSRDRETILPINNGNKRKNQR